MKVKDLVEKTGFDIDGGWGKGYTYWLCEMGFKVLERVSGPADNMSDGKTHDIFQLAKDGGLYKLTIEGNRYDWDETQIDKLLAAEIEEITGKEKEERLEEIRVKIDQLMDGLEEVK